MHVALDAPAVRAVTDINKSIHDAFNPAAVRLITDINKSIQDAFNPAAVRLITDINKSIQDAFNPAAVRAITDINKSFQDALNPAAVRAITDINKSFQDALNPHVVQLFEQFNAQLSTTLGPVAVQASALGRLVVDRQSALDGQELEDVETYLSQFVPLRLSASELWQLYWIFGFTVAVLMAGTAALTPDIEGALMTFCGFIMMFLAIEARLRK